MVEAGLNTTVDPSVIFRNDSAGALAAFGTPVVLGERGADGLASSRGKINLTLLKLDLDLSPVFPSLEAVSGDVQVFLIFVYSLAAVLSLVGNVTVILVLAFGRR